MRRKPAYVEIDTAELAIRMCEASHELTRPMADAQGALDAMDDECRDGWLRAAAVAVEYFQQALATARKPS